jgi:tetratricopeptide (TPR) repeat protein
VTPSDAVQWALYYPPLLTYAPADFPDRPGETWPELARRSVEQAARGDLEGAFATLAGVPPTVVDPRFLVYRAGLSLSVGRVDEALPDLERALALDPRDSQALALRAIVAVARNDEADALRLAEQAVQLAPRSATARLALSYAQQARFDLEGALGSAREAVRLEPGNALAHARLAELLLSVGRLDAALAAAAEAVRLDPGLARAHTVLGFAYLTQIRLAEAAATFERAIQLDQAAPLPRLGLGLTKIRRGELEAGRQELEIAVSLDPADSLLRSYLGKAFYEEKRTVLASEQFTLAQTLDPQDPTPWLYQAIQQQSINRPVEALESLQRSIELNDNRAVYRSRLLLDEDLAARGASLGRLYDELRFQQLALTQGWQSLRTDPTEYSAHRLLADSYRVLPRHELARLSELLQSQLLQPVNIAPVQPQLAEPGLLILDGAGPAEPSLNEFNPLFLRDRLALQVSGLAGGNGTLGDELVVSGIQGPLSFSVGQFHFETDGFRLNNDLKQDIYNAFAQLTPSPWTSLQAEVRVSTTERGDRAVRFLPDDFLPNERHERDAWSARLGFHHRFSPGSDLIASLTYADTKDTLRDLNPVLEIEEEIKERGFLVEAQHLFKTRHFNLISGAGYLGGDHDETSTVQFVGAPIPPSTTRGESDIRHANLYVYSYLGYPKTVTWTLGLSADFLKEALVDRDQINPKFGLAWDILPGSTLRAAVFRVLSRPRIADQSIEPTNVAGFNQFFGTQFGEEDFPGTRAWRYGVAVDQTFTPTLFAGAEFSTRDLDVTGQVTTPDATTVVKEGWDEYLGRAYVYWTPHRWIATSAEYQFERLERDRLLGAGTGILEADTHRLALGVSLFHPSGFSAGIRATYIDQEGEFVPRVFEPGTSVQGSDQFWVTDIWVRYRFPRRRGFITLGVQNVLDEKFQFQDTDPLNPLVQPERVVFVRVTLAF